MRNRKYKSDNLKPYIIVLAAVTLIAVAVLFVLFCVDTADNTDIDFIKVLNVGQADSILLYSNGQSALIDTATESYSNNLCTKLGKSGVKRLDGVFITHIHEDHIGGLSKISDRFTISNIILPDLLKTDEDYAFTAEAVRNDVLSSSGKAYTAVKGLVSKCGDFEITVLGYYGDLKSENNRSVILMVEYDGIKMLLTGDAETQAEERLIADNIDFDCDILKVGHHGSKSSTSDEFLNIATPDYAIISVGADNRYSHPNDETIERLKLHNAEIHRTDLEGDITVNFYSGQFGISSERLIKQ